MYAREHGFPYRYNGEELPPAAAFAVASGHHEEDCKPTGEKYSLS
jgi:hypothetical protein